MVESEIASGLIVTMATIFLLIVAIITVIIKAGQKVEKLRATLGQRTF